MCIRDLGVRQGTPRRGRQGALGTKKKLSIQTKDIKLFKGDVVLLCTDGLYNELGEEYLKKKLQEGISAETLVSEVLLQEPKDNITAIIINII